AARHFEKSFAARTLFEPAIGVMVQRTVWQLPRHAGNGGEPVELSWLQAKPVRDGSDGCQPKQVGQLRQARPRSHGRSNPEQPNRADASAGVGALIDKERGQALLGQFSRGLRKGGKDAAKE